MAEKPKILVVDDESVIRELFVRLLAGGKYDVLTAADGQEALRIAKKEMLATIFLDIRMPGRDGVDILKEIQESNPGANVIMMTAYETAEKIEEALLAGARGNIFKPFDIDRILRIVEQEEYTAEKIPVRRENMTFLLNINAIVFVSANHNFVDVHTFDEVSQTRITLNSLEKRLPNPRFVRTHRGFIAHLSKVKGVIHSRPGIELVMEDQKESRVCVSRSKAPLVKKLLGI